MTKEIKAVIFDQDGLMFDTERISARAWQHAAVDFGIRVGEDFLSGVRGSSSAEAKVAFLKYYGDQIDYDSLREKKQTRFQSDVRTNGLPVKPGLKELLEFLKGRGCKIALATASTREWSLENLRLTGISHYFDDFVCGDMVTKCKPDPEIFLAAAGKLGEKPESSLVLEDSLNGIKAAFAGGFPSIMVPDITQPDDEMRAKATVICKSLFDVIEILEKGHVLKLYEKQ